ncbi:hypothetical protein ACQP1W_02285 [Spirillospora sp. CA-255316]
MPWEYSPLWHISGIRPDELVSCVVTAHRDRFGVEVEIVGMPSGYPAFIDAALLRDGGYAPREEWSPVGTRLDAIPVDFMPDGELRLSARPSDLRHAGELGDMRFLPVAWPDSGESELADGLARAGLILQGWHEPDTPFIPPELAAAAFLLAGRKGRHGASVEFTDPDLAEKSERRLVSGGARSRPVRRGRSSFPYRSATGTGRSHGTLGNRQVVHPLGRHGSWR